MKFQINMSFSYFICVIVGLVTCVLGSDDYQFSTLKSHTYVESAAQASNGALLITVVVIAVIDFVSLIFGICMILIFGRKKIIQGRVLSMPLHRQNQQQQQQQVIGNFGNQAFVPPQMLCSPSMPPQVHDTSMRSPSPTTQNVDTGMPQLKQYPPVNNSDTNWQNFN